MDELLVARAVQALAALKGKARTHAAPTAASHRIAQADEDVAACGASDCAGCYDIGDGRKIHPPKSGKRNRLQLQSRP
jgi:hypothetical protein